MCLWWLSGSLGINTKVLPMTSAALRDLAQHLLGLVCPSSPLHPLF